MLSINRSLNLKPSVQLLSTYNQVWQNTSRFAIHTQDLIWYRLQTPINHWWSATKLWQLGDKSFLAALMVALIFANLGYREYKVHWLDAILKQAKHAARNYAVNPKSIDCHNIIWLMSTLLYSSSSALAKWLEIILNSFMNTLWMQLNLNNLYFEQVIQLYFLYSGHRLIEKLHNSYQPYTTTMN